MHSRPILPTILPGTKLTGFTGKLFGGWQTSGILTLQNGTPFTITSGAEPSWMSSGFVGDFPDAVAGAKLKYNNRNPNSYFVPTSALSLQPAGFVGNLGRDTALSPGIANLDWVLDKRTRLLESLKNLEFRVEMYNVLNRANFGFPTSAAFVPSGVVNPSAGRIVNTGATTSRQLQLGVKLEFLCSIGECLSELAERRGIPPRLGALASQ